MQFIIGTYNIRTETPEDIGDLWETRKDKVMKVIKDYRFDIIGLQEVKESQLRDLKEMEEFSFVGKGRSSDDSNENNPIMYKSKRFDLMDTDTFWLTETLAFEEKAKRWDADCSRICTWAKFKVIETQQEFVTVNTHFDHISEESRYQSALLLTKFIEENFADLPCFLLGDLNGEENERFYQIFEEHFYDTVKHSKHHVGPKVTCTGVTFNHELPWEEYQRIDYIFTNELCEVNKTIVITDRFEHKYPSDHFPVLVEVTINN